MNTVLSLGNWTALCFRGEENLFLVELDENEAVVSFYKNERILHEKTADFDGVVALVQSYVKNLPAEIIQKLEEWVRKERE